MWMDNTELATTEKSFLSPHTIHPVWYTALQDSKVRMVCNWMNALYVKCVVLEMGWRWVSRKEHPMLQVHRYIRHLLGFMTFTYYFGSSFSIGEEVRSTLCCKLLHTAPNGIHDVHSLFPKFCCIGEGSEHPMLQADRHDTWWDHRGIHLLF